MSEQANGQEVVGVVLYTTAAYVYDLGDTTRIDDNVGQYDGSKVRKVQVGTAQVESQRARYASGLKLVATEEEWAAIQTQEQSKKASKKVDTKPELTKCSNCDTREAKLTGGRCKTCAQWFKKHKRERKTGLNSKIDKKDQPAAPATSEVVATPEIPVIPFEEKLAELAGMTVAELAEVPVATPDDTPATPTPTPLVVDTPMGNVSRLLNNATAATKEAVSTCSEKEKQAKELYARSKALQEEAKAARLVASQAKAEAKAAKDAERKAKADEKARQAEALRKPTWEVTINPIDTVPGLRASLVVGGNEAVSALNAAIASGVFGKRPETKTPRASKTATGGATTTRTKSASPRVPSRVLSMSDKQDMKKRLDAGESVNDVATAYGLHPVTVRSIKIGLIKVS